MKLLWVLLQGIVVTQTLLGGLTNNYTSSCCKLPIVYVFQNYENCLAVDRVIAIIKRLFFFWSPVYNYWIAFNITFSSCWLSCQLLSIVTGFCVVLLYYAGEFCGFSFHMYWGKPSVIVFLWALQPVYRIVL